VIAQFARAGINVDTLAAQLQDEGARSFVKSWNDLLNVISSKSGSVDTREERGISMKARIRSNKQQAWKALESQLQKDFSAASATDASPTIRSAATDDRRGGWPVTWTIRRTAS
jgi:hypothetical protein